MATKAEVKAFLKANYVVESDDDQFFSFIFTNTDNGRSQAIFAGVYDEYKVIIMSPFAKTSDISAQQALNAAKNSMWGVKATDAVYCLTTAVWIENLDANEIVDTLKSVSFDADSIESALGLGDDL